MKKKGIITMLIIFAAGLFVQASNTGYVVAVVENKAGGRYFRTQNTEKVEKSIQNNTGLNIALHEVIVGDNVFFEYRTNDVHFYVERKKVERKKNGKLVYKKLSKKERKQLAREHLHTSMANKEK